MQEDRPSIFFNFFYRRTGLFWIRKIIEKSNALSESCNFTFIQECFGYLKRKSSSSELSQGPKCGNGSWAALGDDGARHQCHLVEQETGRCDFEIWFGLMGVDWILPPFSFTASFTHTQTELQCYSERVSCLNPRTESEKERKAERGRKRRRREQEE